MSASSGVSCTTRVAWTGLEGSAARVPLGARKVGKIGRDNAATHLRVGIDSDWLAQPDWAREEGVKAFAGYPLRFRGAPLGVFAVFSREPLDERQRNWLQLFADQAAVAIGHAQALDQVERLSAQLAIDNEALRNALDQRVSWLAAGVAHEINTPLGALVATAGTLEKVQSDLTRNVPEDPARQARRLARLSQTLRDGSSRIQQVVSRLAAFSHLDGGDLKQLSPNDSVQAAVARLRASLPAGVAIEQELSELPAMTCAPGALNQAFFGVLQNAVEAVGIAGTVTVRTDFADGWVVVTISDDGPGIAPESRRRVSTSASRRRNAGLGSGSASPSPNTSSSSMGGTSPSPLSKEVL